jgi:hypothetical protein
VSGQTKAHRPLRVPASISVSTQKATVKVLNDSSAVARGVEFEKLYGFMVSAAALQSRSSVPEEAVVGERVYTFLTENRGAAKKRAVKP